MSIISIEGGCFFVPLKQMWCYRWEDTEGWHAEYFMSMTTPKIGDTIVDGVLVPLVGYKINNDPGFQIKH